MPEEVNRRVIDHSSDILLPYTNRSRDHLLREAFHPSRIYVTGNPIKEVMDFYARASPPPRCWRAWAWSREATSWPPCTGRKNVDLPERLANFMTGLTAIHQKHRLPVLLSLHPRTRSRLEACGGQLPAGVRFMERPGFFDFVHLEGRARPCSRTAGPCRRKAASWGCPP